MHTHTVVPLAAYDMQYTYFGGHVCISANMRDPTPEKRTYVGDGTACGFQRVNINFTWFYLVCVSVCVHERESQKSRFLLVKGTLAFLSVLL